ncbi:MAG TPA: WbqC family protein, partial [Verrucomicrobiae bacterium]|nr:WbqC family protein [Verrucomicrobiae bacterium]
MRVGIMQPYFFPYLGYFDLIGHTDAWVVFDTPQYIRHGWVNRNRVLHPSRGWQYVIAPVRKHDRAASIRDVEVSAAPDWRRRLLAQLEHYRKRAPYFRETMELVGRCL